MLHIVSSYMRIHTYTLCLMQSSYKMCAVSIRGKSIQHMQCHVT